MLPDRTKALTALDSRLDRLCPEDLADGTDEDVAIVCGFARRYWERDWQANPDAVETDPERAALDAEREAIKTLSAEHWPQVGDVVVVEGGEYRVGSVRRGGEVYGLLRGEGVPVYLGDVWQFAEGASLHTWLLTEAVAP